MTCFLAYAGFLRCALFSVLKRYDIDIKDTYLRLYLEDGEIKRIVDTLKELRRKELYWMYRLKTYAPYGLNERDAYEAF